MYCLYWFKIEVLLFVQNGLDTLNLISNGILFPKSFHPYIAHEVSQCCHQGNLKSVIGNPKNRHLGAKKASF